MSRYKIISKNNNIVANADFVEKHYPGDYELLPDPPPVPIFRSLTKLEFVRLCETAGGMTKEITVQAVKDPEMEYFWLLFEMAEKIKKDSPDTEAALAAMEQLGYLPEGAQAVLENWPEE